MNRQFHFNIAIKFNYVLYILFRFSTIIIFICKSVHLALNKKQTQSIKSCALFIRQESVYFAIKTIKLFLANANSLLNFYRGHL